MKALEQVDIGHPEVIRRMRKISRFTIIFPIILFIIVLGAHYYNEYRYEQQEQMMQLRNNRQAVLETQRREALGLDKEDKLNQPVAIDLESNYICSYQDEDASMSAFIENKQIFVSSDISSESTKLLLKEECVYTWQEPVTKEQTGTSAASLIKDNIEGSKVCGLGDYLQMAELASSMGWLNTETIMNALSNYYSGSLASDEAQLRALADSCKEQEVPGSPFTVPESVTFIEKDVSEVQSRTTDSEKGLEDNIGEGDGMNTEDGTDSRSDSEIDFSAIQSLIEGFIPQE